MSESILACMITWTSSNPGAIRSSIPGTPVRHSGLQEMPLMKGTELALKVEALRPQANILLMSAYMLSEVTATGRPFLAKPFSLNGLATKVRAVLDGHSPFERPTPGPRPS